MERYSISFVLGKGSDLHRGDTEGYFNEFLAPHLRSDTNIIFVNQDIELAFHYLFDDALEKYNALQKRPCRRIQNYYRHVASGNRESPFYEVIVQFGDSINTPVGSERGEVAKQMLIEFMKSFQERNPNLYVFFAILHMDGACPRLRIDFVPFYTKGRIKGLDTGTSMNAALAEMGFDSHSNKDTAPMKWENSERNVMETILHDHNCSREYKHVRHKHLNLYEYKEMLRRNAMMKNMKERLLQYWDQKAITDLQVKLTASRKRIEQLEAEHMERRMQNGKV